MAEKKAQELLGELIGEKELEVYRKTGRVLVKGDDCDYLISKSGYAKKNEKNKVIDLCIHLQNNYEVPATDNVIALSLLAKGNGKAFEKQANKVREYNELPEEFKQAACM